MGVRMVGAMALTRNTSYDSGVSAAAFFPAIHPNTRLASLMTAASSFWGRKTYNLVQAKSRCSPHPTLSSKAGLSPWGLHLDSSCHMPSRLAVLGMLGAGTQCHRLCPCMALDCAAYGSMISGVHSALRDLL